MGNILRAGQVSVLSPEMLSLFGSDDDSMESIDARARAQYPDAPPIVWECDLAFRFSFVNDAATRMLGYPKGHWLQEMFWPDQVVHTDDREDAVTYCGLATRRARDHMFEYRAYAADGRIVWLRDFVKVIVGPDRQVRKVRGVMFDITAERTGDAPPPARVPSRDELVA